MKIYMAAAYSNGYLHTNRYRKLNDREKYIINSLKYFLESYHYINKQSFVDAIRDRDDKVFLDSGAFSADNLGVKINIDEYCNYINRNLDIIINDEGTYMIAVLDGIGDAEETYTNQKYMEKKGIRPVPAFHTGEDDSYLKYYVANYDYVALGGMVGMRTSQLQTWLDRVWEKHLIDGAGNPKIKVHGFGITSIPLMERYPWWSCDSSSWVQTAAFGGILIPEIGQIAVSSGSFERHKLNQHVDSLDIHESEYINKLLTDNHFDKERLSNIYESRAAYNIWAFDKINDRINDMNVKFYPEIQELF